MLSAPHHSTSTAGLLSHSKRVMQALLLPVLLVLQLQLLLLLVLLLVSMVQQRGSQLVPPLAVLVRSSVHEALAMQRAAAVTVAVAVVDVPD
jgi:hypothetical protein